MTESARTIVVGAGISGLARAHALGPQADVLVLDAADRPGGLMWTERAEGIGFELGPESLQVGSPATTELLSELGIDARPAPAAARRRYVVNAGRTVPLPRSPLSFLTFPALTWRGKLRALSEPWRARGVALDGSLADFVRHRLGPEALAALVDPFVSGVYAGDPELLSFRAIFPDLHAGVAQHGSIVRALRRRDRSKPRRPATLLSLPDGLGTIPRALADRLGARLRLATEVRAIERGRAGWRLETDAGRFAAERLVVATPALAAARLLDAAEPALARELASLTSENLAVVHTLWPRERAGHPLDGFGYLVPSRERLGHLGTLFCSSMRPEACPADSVLVRTFLGGAREPDVVDASDDELVERCVREVGALLRLRGRPDWRHVVRWRGVLPRYDLEHPARLARVRAPLAGRDDLELLGNYLDGIGLPRLIERARETGDRDG